MVYQECFISRYTIPPLKVVGWEGLFGLICLGFSLIPVGYDLFCLKKNSISFLVFF